MTRTMKQRRGAVRRLICNNIPTTHNSLSSLSNLKDHQTLNHVLEACRLSLDSRTAFETHARIIRYGYGTYPSLVASLISTYELLNQVNYARRLMGLLFSWDLDLITMNIFIENLMKIGACKYARKLFDKMSASDVVTWNSLIGGYVKNAQYEEALRVFTEMLNSKAEPDGFTFASIISGCAHLGALNKAQWIHALMIEKRIETNSILSSGLIDMYSKCGRIESAKEVFESVPHNDVSVWNAIIKGLAVHGLAMDAIALFSKMELENVLPDCITFVGILTACSHSGLVEQGRKFFDLMKHYYSIQPQLEHYGAMIDLLGRAGFLEEAHDIIKTMPINPDVVIWRAFLSACRTYKSQELGEVAISNISHLNSGDYVLLSNIYCFLKKWDSAERVRQMMKYNGISKNCGKSWVEVAGVIHNFQVGDRLHLETNAIYKLLEGLVQITKANGYVPVTELVFMDVSEEEREGNLSYHSERLALAYGILKTSPGTEVRVSKNLRICYDCHCWIKMVSRLIGRVIVVRDRIRFHQFEGGLCSCGDYW